MYKKVGLLVLVLADGALLLLADDALLLLADGALLMLADVVFLLLANGVVALVVVACSALKKKGHYIKSNRNGIYSSGQCEGVAHSSTLI